MIGLFLSVLFKKDGHADHDVRIKAQLFYTLNLLSLVGVLTALGGRATIGISYHTFSYWKKAKQSET
ncbi:MULTISPECIES: hypothetical protein [Peribacillus]|uniref:Uncharacterized protein n=1 Tax=Peribacillus simplex TaxID=1478 RepID=A0A9W4L0Z2_9BACI|nr:hypothetical protein [Peribacillus simplex]MDR4925037.1 hypothetical protein [Peribacillus simplex]WHX90260.1 hypothetical protein QNH50_19880 [Peribacillus simplex]CAH0236142.1 hypothetical protein SRABI133_02766 [Peribacillus simplex]